MPDMEQFEMDGVVYDIRDPTKAPAGYGLGVKEPDWMDDCNHATHAGLYLLNSATLNIPTGISNNAYGALLALPRTGDRCIVQVYLNAFSSAVLAVRTLDNNGGWQPWEWVNPPMEWDTEYRTTERHEGKPVYTMRYRCWSFPNAEVRAIDIQWIGAARIVRASGTMSTDTESYTLPYIESNGTVGAWINARNTKLYIGATTDYSAYNGYVDLYYTKD